MFINNYLIIVCLCEYDVSIKVNNNAYRVKLHYLVALWVSVNSIHFPFKVKIKDKIYLT
jgi:hypothetical protein